MKGGRPVRVADRPRTRLQSAAVAAVFIGAPPDAQDEGWQQKVAQTPIDDGAWAKELNIAAV
jgi:hypothetical protein